MASSNTQQPTTGERGVFKLKIKLNTQPPPQPPPQPPQKQLHHHHGEDDDQEDQLAGSSDLGEEEEEEEDEEDENEIDHKPYDQIEEDDDQIDSLSSPPPPPVHPQPVSKRSSKPKARATTNNNPHQPPSKKRKTQPNPSQSVALPDQFAHHHQSEFEPPQPQQRSIKQPNPSINSKSKSTRSNIVPLSDAELLSAAGSQYPTHSTRPNLSKPRSPVPTTSSAHPPAPVTSKPASKKKKANPDGPKKRVSAPANPSTHETNPQLNPPPLQTSINQNLLSPQVNTKPAVATKSKSKKGSKLSQAKLQQDPFQATPNPSAVTTPIVRPPPQPRLQHDYTLGPPPPPPVPAFKPFAVGPAPRTQGQFLPAQILEKRTPKVRSWKKIKREVIGISGIPFWVWTYAGDEHSDYAIAKQNKILQAEGTPNSTQDAQYFPQVPQSRPASVASSHAKPSPNRASSSHRANSHKIAAAVDHHQNPSTSANLGGPVLPASFRRPPMAIVGSPLGNHTMNHKS